MGAVVKKQKLITIFKFSYFAFLVLLLILKLIVMQHDNKRYDAASVTHNEFLDRVKKRTRIRPASELDKLDDLEPDTPISAKLVTFCLFASGLITLRAYITFTLK